MQLIMYLYSKAEIYFLELAQITIDLFHLHTNSNLPFRTHVYTEACSYHNYL